MRLIFACGAAIAAIMGALAQSSALASAGKPTPESALAAISSWAPQALAQQMAPGMVLAITDRTHTLRVIALVYANVDSKQPVTRTTRFMIGSITKSMTALALLQLHDGGSVDLNAPVSRYLPDWKIGGGSGINVHELLSHTAGLPNEYALVDSVGYDVASLRDAHTIFAPGSSWSYSNDGYSVVGAIISAASHYPWYQELTRSILEPLDMSNTSAYTSPALATNAATGYVLRDSDLPEGPRPPLIAAQPIYYVDPAGSVLTTADDMARYMRFYLNGGVTDRGVRLLKPATFVAMTTPDRLNNRQLAGEGGSKSAFLAEYGYGLAILNIGGDHVVGHRGGVSGYTACMLIDLTRGFGVIAMTNLIEAPAHPCPIVRYAIDALRAQRMGERLPSPPPSPPDPAIVINAEDYAGAYHGPQGGKLFVETQQHRLYIRDGNTAYRLVPSGKDLFWTDDPRFRRFLVEFGRNSSLRVDEFTNGPDLYTNNRFGGPSVFSYPVRYNALAGRYDAFYWDAGGPVVGRIVIVKGRLMADGVTPIRDNRDGTFSIGAREIRFDTEFDGKMQRMWINGTPFYRVDLP
jgi:CubicO group peptidase (beta-lactamase class C family)